MEVDLEQRVQQLEEENARLRSGLSGADHIEFIELAKHLREVFWIFDLDVGRQRYVSPSYEDVWGRSVEEIYADPDNWNKAIHPLDRTRVQESFYNRRPGDDWKEEYRIVRPSGEVRWILDRSVHIRDEDGRETCLAGIAEDITEKVMADERLRARDEELARVLRLGTMGEMAANIAHELNQPLAAIITHAEVCHSALSSGRPVSEELLQDLEDVIDQAERAGKIIRQIRRFVRKQESEHSPTELNALVRESVRFLEPTARVQQVRFELELDEEPFPVLADDVQIQQVVTNLVRNAIEALAQNPPHRRVVRVTSSAIPKAYEVTICDEGIPLTPREVESFFEPFRTSRPDGLGMGLSISRTLVEAHGGRLTGEPNGDRGLRVSFTLPRPGERDEP